jgi:hypothetical protein
MALVEAGLVEPFMGKKKGGVRLSAQALSDDGASEQGLPFVCIFWPNLNSHSDPI